MLLIKQNYHSAYVFTSFSEVYLFWVLYPVMAKCDQPIALQWAMVCKIFGRYLRSLNTQHLSWTIHFSNRKRSDDFDWNNGSAPHTNSPFFLPILWHVDDIIGVLSAISCNRLQFYNRYVPVKGEAASRCEKFATYYRSLCPGEWVCKRSSFRK
jgi:hypothetical protein